MKKIYKLTILASHPIQYQVPLFKKLAQHPEIDLVVYFCSNHGVIKKIDPGFGVAFKWDIPLLEGYRYKFLKNYFPSISGNRLWMSINPDIIKGLWNGHHDAIIIHGYISITNWFAFLGAWLTRTPILFRGETILRPNQPRFRQVMKYLYLKFLFSKIDAFLPIGTRSREFYFAYGVTENRMFLTPYSVDNEFFITQMKIWHKRKEEIKKGLSISEDTPVILYASKITKRKNPMDLLIAFAQLRQKAALVFVGDGELRLILESYVKDKSIANVFFTGFKNQTELPKYYAAADIFVLPSSYEPWGLVVNEAMCYALPIITTDTVAASADLVYHGKNGFIYPASNVDKLAKYLTKLLQEPELRKKMGKRSFKIIEKWSYKEDVGGILAALKNVKKY